jgi:hypothetical protein
VTRRTQAAPRGAIYRSVLHVALLEAAKDLAHGRRGHRAAFARGSVKAVPCCHRRKFHVRLLVGVRGREIPSMNAGMSAQHAVLILARTAPASGRPDTGSASRCGGSDVP